MLELMHKLLLPLVFISFAVSAGFSQQTFISGYWTYTLSGSNEATIVSYNGPGGAVIIPETIDLRPVKALGGLGPPIFGVPNTNVTSLTIPNNVTNIGRAAFATCAALKNVVIPDSVLSIGDYAFESCTSLTNVTIGNSVTSIGFLGFGYCTALTSVVIPDSVSVVGASAFAYCSNLRSVAFGSGVGTIGEQAFLETEITNVLLPNTITHIGHQAFPEGISFSIDQTALARNKTFVAALANEILAKLPDNYGIATKADLVKLPQTIVFTAPKSAVVGQQLVLRASTKSGLPISITSNRPDIVRVQGLTAFAVAPGTAELTATQAGDATHAPARPLKATVVVR